ncbi:MAG: CoA transferase [Lachnospiraceae bacterium]|nr:CoA transferase [Lachnospiraceae bacterium]
MGPLEGIKVIDFSTHVAVPCAARLLGDWGAHVIKVENPNGDLWRYFGIGVNTPITDEENPIFEFCNSNKEIIAINTKEEKGREVLYKLLEDADLFLTNVRGKSLKKMGLDHETLMAKFPKLTYFYFNGYGEKGPMAAWPGFDISAYWASSGFMKDYVWKGSKPFMPGVGGGDILCASLNTAAILAALTAAKKEGKGVYATNSLYGTGIWHDFGDIIVKQPQYGYERPQSEDKTLNPLVFIYRCKNDTFCLPGGVDFPTAVDRVLDIHGLSDLKEDPYYHDAMSRDENGSHPLLPLLKKSFAEKTAAEWVELYQEKDVVCQEVKGAESVWGSEQAWANDYLTTIYYPSSRNMTIMPNAPVRFGGYDTKKSEHVGGVGWTSRKVMREHGFTEEEINECVEKGYVVASDE